MAAGQVLAPLAQHGAVLPELHDLLHAEGMRVLSTDKIEYPWSYVLEEPPEGMSGHRPWNWMVVAERVG